MPIDARIAMTNTAGPALENPQNYLLNQLNMEGKKSANQLAQMNVTGAQKAVADQAKADAAYRNAVDPTTGQLDPARLRASFASSDIGTQIPEVDKKLAEIDKLHGEGQVQFADLVTKHLALAKQDMDGVTTPAQYLQHVENSLKDPVLLRYFASHGMTPEQIMAQTTAKIAQSQTTPTGFDDLLRESKLGADKALEVAHVDLGNREAAINKYGGRQVADYIKGVDPSKAADYNKVVSSTTDNAGNVTHFNARGEVVSTTKGAGKQSATYEKNVIARKQLSSDLASAEDSLVKLTADKGLLDKATGSGAGAAADATAAFFGHATEGAIAIGELQPIYDKILKMVPRFEGPQSDKDTQSYKDAAGNLANPKVPNAIKKAAAKTILELVRKRREQFTTKDAVDAGVGGVAADGIDHSNPLLAP